MLASVCLSYFLVSTYSLDDYAGFVALLQRKPTRLNASDVQHFGERFYDLEIAACMRAGFEEIINLALLYPDELSALTCVPASV